VPNRSSVGKDPKSKSGNATILSDEHFPALGGGSRGKAVAPAAVAADESIRGDDPSRLDASLAYAEAVKSRPKPQSSNAKKASSAVTKNRTDGSTSGTPADVVTQQMLGLSVDD
jgi:hypothetical protein